MEKQGEGDGRRAKKRKQKSTLIAKQTEQKYTLVRRRNKAAAEDKEAIDTPTTEGGTSMDHRLYMCVCAYVPNNNDRTYILLKLRCMDTLAPADATLGNALYSSVNQCVCAHHVNTNQSPIHQHDPPTKERLEHTKNN